MSENKININLVIDDVYEFEKLLVAFGEIFEEDIDYPSKEYLTKLLRSEQLLVITAKVGNEVVGGLTAYVLVNYQVEGASIYIYDLGVKESFRNNGIGKSLIKFLIDYSKQNNIQDIFVDTEQIDNEEAIAFYNKTGFNTETKVLQYTYKI
ncbi:putative acetyltransferase [Gemella morbillorum]|uniref:GNAT family N-acetyltransferase n=1 Tax=Gemella morbillorum TaxID=29391 RepID=UPI0001EFF4B8|nr:GNAT family N-acetyltransferase [Gemella morbillorum]EFV35276.1 acetyltransferase [Gemella morbillorum M424]UBH80722.1 GNAT family N-acetyltransferase [Gemella morbillorum]SQH56125.1 putative acetyltransferase [Gemella morbillorum]